MQKVLTADEMREVDRLTTEKYGIPSIILMENAAHATARIITEKLGGLVEDKSIVVLCGKGNNGGDGAAIARILWKEGAYVDVYLFGKVEETKDDARTNFEIIEKIDGREYPSSPYLFLYDGNEIDQKTWARMIKQDLIIDACFGTGLTRPIEENLPELFNYLNGQKRLGAVCPPIVSIDIPSGLNSDSASEYDEAINADFTVTFTSPKPANVLAPNSNYNGELFVEQIGSPYELLEESKSELYLAEEFDAYYWLKQTVFSNDSYKNKRGNALLIVGSKNYTGAAVLAGNSAMSSGVGLVTIATSETAQESVSSRVLAEIITKGLEDTINGAISEKAFDKIQALSEKADVIAIGSGLNSDEETTRKLVRKVIEKRTTPIIIDADGLNSLSPFDLQGSEELPLVLTPHEGEFLRLLGNKEKDSINDRVASVRNFTKKHNVILVLKGERTLIGEPNGRVVINPTGNSGLGKAGNGDNLTGIITGFIAQAIQLKVDIFETVVAAVYIAGLAGDIAEKKFGKRTMLASDVRKCLSDAFGELENV